MFDEQDYMDIVDYYRKNIKLTPIKSLDDSKKNENSILLNYYITENPSANIEEILSDPNKFLKDYKSKKINNPKILELCKGNSSEIPTASILTYTDKFAFGRDDKIIIADKIPKKYVFPTGATIDYFLLKNEKCANVPALEGGYQMPELGIFVRETYLNLMSAYLNLMKKDPIVKKYNRQGNFKESLKGFVILHELIHQHGKYHIPEEEIEEEVLSFSEKYAMDWNHFKLHHYLASHQGDETGNNVSKNMIKKLKII